MSDPRTDPAPMDLREPDATRGFCAANGCEARGTDAAEGLPYCAAHYDRLDRCPAKDCVKKIPNHRAACAEHQPRPTFDDGDYPQLGGMI